MLDLLTLDDRGDPAMAVNNTRALIEHKVLGCVTYFGGDGVSGSLPLLEPYHIPMIAPYTGARAFRLPANRYLLHARASTDEEMHAWVSYCIARGITLFAVYYQEDENGFAGFESIKAALKNEGLGLLVSSSFPVGGNVSIAGIKSAMINPQSIVMIGDPVAMANFTAVAKNQWPACLFHMVSFASRPFLDALIARNVSAAEAKNIFVTQVVPPPQSLDVLNSRNLPPISLGHTRFLWDFALAMNSTFPGVNATSFSTAEGFMNGMFVAAILVRMQPFNYNSSRLRPYLDQEGVNETTISLDDEASLRAWRDYMIDTLFVESMVDVSGIRLGPFVPNITCPADAFDCLQPPSPPCTQGMQNVFLVQPEVTNRSFTELFDWRVPSPSCNAFSQDTPPDEIPLVFGQSAVLSGTALGNQDLGFDMRNGILAAFAEANKSPAKGVRGRPLLLLTMDDRYDANQAKINAKALIANQSLVAVLGALGTGPTEAVIPLYAAAGIPLVGTLSGARTMRQSGLINIRALYDDEVAAMVDLAISRGVKKFSVYKQMDAFGDAGENAAKLVLQYHKLSLHSVSWYNRTVPDPYPAFRNFTDTGVPEAIIMFSTVLISAQFIELTLNDTAWASTLFLMASPCDPDRLHPRLSKAALQTGRVHATTVVPPVGNDAFSKNFLHALSLLDPRLFTGSLPPYTPTFTAMEGYLIGRFAIAAMARVTEFTGKAMLGEIYGDQGITIDGIKMGPYTSSCNMGRRIVHMVRFEDSNTTKFTRVSDFRAQSQNDFIPDCGAYTLYNDANFSCPDGYKKEYINDDSLASTCKLCLS
jgi:ABC-type branched-subunit amino acid transport system substrate-binding protein